MPKILMGVSMKLLPTLFVFMMTIPLFASEKICETKDQKGAIHCEEVSSMLLFKKKLCKFYISTSENSDGEAMKDVMDPSKDFEVSNDKKTLDKTCKYLKKQDVVDADVKTCVLRLSTIGSCGRIDGGQMDGLIKVEDMPEELDHN